MTFIEGSAKEIHRRAQRFLTERPARTAHKACALGNAGSLTPHSSGSRSRAPRRRPFNDVGAVILRPVAHDPVLAVWRSHAHLRRSVDQSSSASRFTAGASEFFILSQSGERRER